jgi:fluoride exporter
VRSLLAVLAGGIVGTALRLGLDALLPHASTGFPLSTLIENVSGAFALGLLVAAVWPVAPAWVRLALGTGLLGSYTTFSALAISLVQLTALREPGLAALYLVVSLIAGLAAAYLGIELGARLRRRSMPSAAGEPGVDE